MAKSTDFLDTNCLLRYVLGDNEAQAKKTEQLIRHGVQVEVAVFFEFVWVLQSFYKMNRQQVHERLKIIIEDKRIGCERKLLDEVGQHYLLYPQISFLDIYLSLMAQRKGGYLRTFDENLSKKLSLHVHLIV
ncbi:MAG TPA: PIN domain-containing protein [Candidatus Dormibacteraeota bacterium]|nr:PIN domain-containing protein [Candidatus Dormibacteraeota bacterium]